MAEARNSLRGGETTTATSSARWHGRSCGDRRWTRGRRGEGGGGGGLHMEEGNNEKGAQAVADAF
jgi:hypothetical protein